MKAPKDYTSLLQKSPAIAADSTGASVDLVGLTHQCLSDAFQLLALSWNAHWNVESPTFYSLHAAFNDQYEDLVESVDTLAEQIRQQGAYVSVDLARFAADSGISMPQAPQSALDWIAALIAGREKWAADLRALQSAAAGTPNLELQNTAIDLGSANRKVIWMLKSAAKGA